MRHRGAVHEFVMLHGVCGTRAADAAITGVTDFLAEVLGRSATEQEKIMSIPTVVLVHGAFAESSSWNGVVTRLHAAGHTVVAAANPLRSLTGDAASVAALLDSIEGPIVLVGHSYGGAVISDAARGRDPVKALVW